MANNILAQSYKDAADKIIKNKISEGFTFEALYEYRNRNNEIIYCRIRLKNLKTGEKWIRPLSMISEGVFAMEEPKFLAKKPLYCLHLLDQFPEAQIWIVEGEKCADKLNEFFIAHNINNQHIAITSGGATSDSQVDWEVLYTRQINIIPDFDESGINYAKNVANILKTNCKVTIIDPSALGVSKSEDIADLLESNHKFAPQDLFELKLLNHDHNEEVNNNSKNILIDCLAHIPNKFFNSNYKNIAKAINIEASQLKQMVNQKRQTIKQSDAIFKMIEPWPEQVNFNDLLQDIIKITNNVVVLKPHCDIAIALWIIFTWLIDIAETAPLLIITSPEKRSGKTTLLDLLTCLVKNPMPTSNVTHAALFRTIEQYEPTILIDEGDMFLAKSDELCGIINSGHTKSTAFVLRCVGDNHDAKRFSTWGAKAISMIGKPLDTILDRAIVIELRRKLSEEKVIKIRNQKDKLEIIARKLLRFSEDNALILQNTQVSMPDGISDRAQDNWELLIAIAKLAGTEFEAQAINAMFALSGLEKEELSKGVMLLQDIADIFNNQNKDKIFTKDLIIALCKDPELPWSTYNQGKPINDKQLAKLLKAYNIKSQTLRIELSNGKGYKKNDFEESFKRYLPDYSSSAVTPLQSCISEESTVTDKIIYDVTDKSPVTSNSFKNQNCDAVTANNMMEGTI